MKKIRNLGLLLLAVVLIFSLTGCGDDDSENSVGDDEVIAEFDGGEVTKKDFDTYMGIAYFFDPSLKQYLGSADEEDQVALFDAYLGTYIGEKYLANQIADDPDLKNRAKETLEIFEEGMLEEFGDTEEYDAALKAENITADDLLEYMVRYYKAEEYLVNKAYQENKEMFSVATVSHILISFDDRTEEEAKALALDVLNQLEAGADFAELAIEYTDDAGSVENGGTYEDVPVALWVPEFMEAAIKLPLNELSDLVETEYGYHIIKVTERELPELEDVTDEGRNVVFSNVYTDFIKYELETILK